MICYYLNSTGKKIDLMKSPYRLITADFFNYEWDKLTRGGRIYGFERLIFEKELKLDIFCKESEFLEKVNYIEDVFAEDRANMSPGRLYVNEYYLTCFVNEMQNDEWEAGVYTVVTLNLISDFSCWRSEEPHIFKSAEITSSNNKRYPNKYSHRYSNGLTNTSITNEHFTDCGFRIIIYGPAVKPQVIIGGYAYYVDVILEEGEYLEIDSALQTVTKVMNTGIHVNCFHNRDKKNNMFRKIPPGRLTIDWSGKFDFDLILYEERSQPKW